MRNDDVAAVLQRLRVRVWLQLQQLLLSAQAITWPMDHIHISVCVLWLIFFIYSPSVTVAQSQPCLRGAGGIMRMCGCHNGYNADSDAGKHPHFTHITNESSLSRTKHASRAV